MPSATKLRNNSSGETLLAVRYTDPDSVKRIMDLIGSRGVNNSPDGLFIYSGDQDIHAQKEDWIGLRKDGTLVHVQAGDLGGLYSIVH